MARKPAPVEGVYERGSGIWYARYRMNGKLVRKSFGSDRNAAVAYVEKARTLKRSGGGIVPATARRALQTFAEMAVVGGTTTVAELCDDLERHIQKNPTSYKDQVNPPRRIACIRKVFGHRLAASIKPSEIMDWLDRMDREPATLNRYKATLSRMYQLGKVRHDLTVNPAAEFKQRKPPKGKERFLKPEEEARIRAVMDRHIASCGPQNAQLRKHLIHRVCEFEVALGTGMRRGEQYGLTWDDVDFNRREITARDTKNGTDRVIPMIDAVVKAMHVLKATPLERRNRSNALPNDAPKDAVFSIDDNKKWWAAVTKAARVKDMRWHDLRHTFCSRLVQRGVNLKVVQEAAGHLTIQTTAKYAHLDKRSLREAMTVLNAI